MITNIYNIIEINKKALVLIKNGSKENFLKIPTEYSKDVIIKLSDKIQGNFWRKEKEEDIIIGEEYFIGPNQAKGQTTPEAIIVKIIEEKKK